MRKNFFGAIIFVIAILICGCLSEEKVVTYDMIDGDAEIKSDSPEKIRESEISNWVEKNLESMTLEEKIGQMIMIGVNGTALNDEIISSLNKFHFGGVIFFDRNLENVAQAKKFANDIESAANQKVPMFFALDEEGGRVARGKNFLEVAPSQESIGLEGDPEAAKRWAIHNATILKSIGVNLNFAPVADVGSKDTRSFGDDPQLVAKFVDAAAQGYESENFLYTLKHFPGIGKSKIDPHQEISSVEVGKEILAAEDIFPFKKIIDAHDNSKFMIMVGHLKYDALDPTTSASLSQEIITKLLRDELGYSGVVITDDLEMGAIKNNVDISTLGVKMILAGGDIALICHDQESRQIIYNSILEAVKRGEISEARIDESVRRILKMKFYLR